MAWASVAVVALLATGGAADRPQGTAQGVPSAAAIVLVAAAAVALARTGLMASCSSVALVAAPAVLATTGLPIPGIGALTGPPLFALVLAGLALAVVRAPVPTWRPRILFPIALLLYLGVAARVQSRVGPEGDEPHYLMVADSLLRDGDLSLEDDYARGRYRAFHAGELAPHYRVRGRNGEIYSLHAVGLSLLVLPAYAIGGYPAASFFMAFLAALLAREVRELVRAATGSAGLAEGVGWLAVLSPPLIHYAGLVFTEVPAALAVAVVLRCRAADDPRRWWLLEGSALAVLPWLNVRYAPLAVLLLAYLAWRRPALRLLWGLLVPTIVSAAGLALFHQALYGFFDPRRVYGRRPELSLASLPEGTAGLLLDQEFGLLVYAPVFVLAVPGLFLLGRRDHRRAVASLALVAVVLVVAGSWHLWRGGFNPPARFLVPVLAPLALGVAGALSRGLAPAGALLLGWSIWTGLAGGAQPQLVHRDRDGTAPFFRRLSGAEEWTRLLPGFVTAESAPDRRSLAAVWGVALVAAATSARGGGGPGRWSLALAGLVAAAATASTLSTARTGARDAVRIVGRPGVLLPGGGYEPALTAVWGPSDLDWGPLYEPHRHPGGAVVGSRLPLPPGRYRLRLLVEEPPGSATDPVLQVRPLAAARIASLVRDGGGRECVFDIRPGEAEVTLAVTGGGPFLLKGLRLEAFNPRGTSRSKLLMGEPHDGLAGVEAGPLSLATSES